MYWLSFSPGRQAGRQAGGELLGRSSSYITAYPLHLVRVCHALSGGSCCGGHADKTAPVKVRTHRHRHALNIFEKQFLLLAALGLFWRKIHCS